MTKTQPEVADLSALTSEYSAHNYHPLPVVAASASGAWVTDIAGRRYLDLLAGYSALNFGHRHPRLVAAAIRQLERVTLVSRAFDHDQFGPFCAELAGLCGMEMVLPMNTGAEAVETAIKVARKWGYATRGVRHDEAVIIVFDGNFHGRTTTIVSFSSDPDARDDFGPYTPGFVSVCLLYTSDAADDLLCVDLGGRRIIKKKKQDNTNGRKHNKNKKTTPHSQQMSK